MYPVHLNYTTTLPCKTITVKIIFFSQGIFGNTWIIMKNGHQTHQTLILLITMSGELHYTWTLQDISTQAKYRRRAEESLANNMGWSAIELRQQSHTELRKKTSSLCESLERTLWTRLEINCFAPGFELLASCDSLKCQIKFPCFRLISIQALWWKL